MSPEGQQQFLEALIDVVQNVPRDLGWGVFWWYPEAQPTSGLNVWEGGRYGLFDQNGNLLPAASAFEQFIPPTLAGDYNGDGRVDAADFVAWRESDGTVNGYDAWRSNFGNKLDDIDSASTANATVPEPRSAVLSILGVLLLMRRVGRKFSCDIRIRPALAFYYGGRNPTRS